MAAKRKATRARRGTIYLIHFSAPLGTARKQALHYLGWADTWRLDVRFAEHCAGRGAKITAAARAHGITFTFFVIAKGTRDDERTLKRRRKHKLLCPICQAAAKAAKHAGQQALSLGLDEPPF